MSVITKIKNRSKWLLSYPVYWYYKLTFKVPEIKSIEETIEKVIETNASIARYGDGELDIMVGRDIPFQKYNPELAQKMKDILRSNEENFIVGLPDALIRLSHLNEKSVKYWKRNLRNNLKYWVKLLLGNKVYYNTSMTRPYMGLKDKSNCYHTFELLKKIWDGREILFIEGEKSRLGVGNDLFDNANSVKRILCPAKNAFDFYNDIISYVNENVSRDVMILIALGPSATAMAYDLYKLGYQALDIGHIDIEYEWFKMGATQKVAIKNKYTNEAIDMPGDQIGELADKKYISEIITKIGC